MFPFTRRYEALLFLVFVLSGLFFLGYRGDQKNAAFFMAQSRGAAEIQMDTFIRTGIETRLDHIRIHLEALAHDPGLFPFFQGALQQEAQVRSQWKNFLRLHPDLLYVYFADNGGRLFFEPQGPLPPDYDARRRPWFRHALQDPENTLWTVPYTELPTGRRVISAVRALKDPVSGKITGVLGLDLDVSHLDTLLRRIPLPEHSLLGILSSDGQVVASPHPEKMRQLLDHPASLLAIMNGETAILDILPGTPPLLISTRILKNPEWRILQGLPQPSWEIPESPGMRLALILMAATLGIFLLMHNLCRMRIRKDIQYFEAAIRASHEKGLPPPANPWPFLAPFGEICARMVQERLRSDDSTKTIQSRMDTLLEKAPMGIFRSSSEGRFIEVNSAMARILEYASPEEVIRSIDDIPRELYLDQEDRKVLQDRLKEGLILDFPTRFRKKNGTIGHASITAYPETGPDGRILAIRGFFTDITRHHQLETQLRRIAHTDRLTGLPNRRSFMDLLVKETSRFCRYGNPFTLVVLNVDDFRGINARHSHAMGDRLLASLARRLSENLRSCDTLARTDGDTFAIHMAQTPLDEGLSAAMRLHETLQEAELVPSSGIRITLSVGVTAPRDALRCPDMLLQEAEALMYTVKTSGGKGLLAFSLLPAKSDF